MCDLFFTELNDTTHGSSALSAPSLPTLFFCFYRSHLLSSKCPQLCLILFLLQARRALDTAPSHTNVVIRPKYLPRRRLELHVRFDHLESRSYHTKCIINLTATVGTSTYGSEPIFLCQDPSKADRNRLYLRKLHLKDLFARGVT